MPALPDRSIRLALATAVLAASAGCCRHAVRAEPPSFVAPKEYRPAYVATIALDEKGCPAGLKFDLPNCASAAEDCVVLRRGDTVTFRSAPARPFELHFDPFSNPVRSNADGVAEVRVDKAAMLKHLRPYPFSVTTKGCRPFDPIIIISEW